MLSSVCPEIALRAGTPVSSGSSLPAYAQEEEEVAETKTQMLGERRLCLPMMKMFRRPRENKPSSNSDSSSR